jgi:hypothetical protein
MDNKKGEKMSDKIKSCYMDEQPKLQEEVKLNGEWIATINPPSQLDMMMITNYGNIKTLAEVIPQAIERLISDWASDKPKTVESLATFPQNCQNVILEKIMQVINQANKVDDGIAKN